MSADFSHQNCSLTGEDIAIACRKKRFSCEDSVTAHTSESLFCQDDLAIQKETVRRELKERAQDFSADYLAKTSRSVCERILQSEIFSRAQIIFGYLAFAGEISVDTVLREALRLGKRVAVPWIVSRTEMQAVQLTSMQDLPLDRYGIRTAPEPVNLLDPGILDLILVPGAGFTLTGCRMGRGAGYYDRFLPRTTGLTLGITCDLFVRDFLPCGPWDCKVSALVTESRLLSCSAEQKSRETVLK